MLKIEEKKRSIKVCEIQTMPSQNVKKVHTVDIDWSTMGRRERTSRHRVERIFGIAEKITCYCRKRTLIISVTATTRR